MNLRDLKSQIERALEQIFDIGSWSCLRILDPMTVIHACSSWVDLLGVYLFDVLRATSHRSAADNPLLLP